MTSATTDEPTYYRLCSSCKRPLAFGASYYVCSVSTCNRGKMTLTFCSVPCFQAHVPMLRHREAWAEEQRAPSRQVYVAERLAEQQAEQEAGQRAAQRAVQTEQERLSSAARERERRITGVAPSVVRTTASAPDPKDPTHAVLKEPLMSNEEVLVVVSKVKAYIRAKSEMNTADAVATAISDVVRAACDRAIERAKADGRKTVLARDVGGDGAA